MAPNHFQAVLYFQEYFLQFTLQIELQNLYLAGFKKYQLIRLCCVKAFNADILLRTVSRTARVISMFPPAASRILQHVELHLDIALYQRTQDRLSAIAEALTP